MKINQDDIRHVVTILAVATAVGLAITNLVSSDTVLSLLVQAVIYAVFALGVGVLLRQNGLVSFGHAFFFGAAGYLAGWLLQYPWMSGGLVIVGTVLLVMIVAFMLGLVFTRVPGIAFAMLTLAVGQMVYLFVSRSRSFLGGADGMHIEWPDQLLGLPLATFYEPSSMFFLSWMVLFVLVAILSLLFRTRFGSITEAVRDNEERARFIGIGRLFPRAAVYAVSAGVSTIGGLLSALYTGFVSPESLHWSVSGAALVMVIVGGYKKLWGPVVGAIIYFLIKDYLGELTSYWMSILGVLVILVVVFLPDGISGALSKWRSGLGSATKTKMNLKKRGSP